MKNKTSVSNVYYNTLATYFYIMILKYKPFTKRLLATAFLFCMMAFSLAAQQLPPNATEIIYGRKDGMALTMVALKPTGKANGKAVINIMSGGWFSMYEWLPWAVNDAKPFLDRGYQVFCVMHGSQPRYTIPDAVADLHRAVRFIRYHATDYKIDGTKIGITGSSAGGHLSLMMGTDEAKGDTAAKDPVDRVSGRVQAVACFFPPTDFLNFGMTDANLMTAKPALAKSSFLAPFLFTEWDSVNKYYPIISDTAKQNKIAWQMSPIYQVSPDDAPTFIIHGDADKTVPLQQSKIMLEKLKAVGVPCKLQVKQGADHGWDNMNAERALFADWFDMYLK
ncbi:MAG TPA: alpha/beta hydrolase [Chitinophagaceae bacterium]|nr:alpha/beta hydrolase [Chitinophagaceae bacterium]